MISRREANTALLGGIALAAIPGLEAKAQQQPITLPKPQINGGKPLMQALALRRSTREYSDKPLPPQILSDLLWAAWGINRPGGKLHTAPNWRGRAQVDLYLAMADGVWIYEPAEHRLLPHMPDDVRKETTTEQPFVGTAPLNIVYVCNQDRLGEVPEESKIIAGVADTAVISQNVYLFCASAGLATVVRGLVPREKLARRLGLSPRQVIYLAQTVGYPR